MQKFKWGIYILLAIIGAYFLYAPFGMWMADNTVVNTKMEVTVKKGESHAVAMAAALMQTQLDHNWIPNNPFWQPSSWLDNTPNFQKGILNVEEQFAFAMAQFLGRTRGSSSMDEDLKSAQGKMNYAPDVWVYDPSVSWYGFSATSENQFKNGVDFYNKYQARLAKGQAVYDIRADSLISTMGIFSNNMGSLTANIEKHIITNPNGLTDTTVDDIYYFNKGQAYAYYMILRELGKDFESVIKEKKQDQIWGQMLDSLRIVAELSPTIVFNGDSDTMFLNSHLSSQGFYVLLANKRMKEVMDGLIK